MPVSPLLKSLPLVLMLSFGSMQLCAQESAPLPQAVEPSAELTAETLYKVFLAEIAAARRQPELGAYLYLDVAKRTRDARLAKRATELAMQSGQAVYISEAAKLWSQLDPDAKDSLRALALTLSGEKAKLEDLEPALRRMLEIESTPTESLLLQLPSLLVRYPDKAAVQAMTERLTQPYLQLAEAHIVRAVMALSAEDRVKAEREAQKALDIQPDSEVAARVRSQAAPAARKAQAMEELGRFTKRNPLARGARQDYARWLISEKRYKEASDEYSRLLGDAPNDDEVALGAAAAFLLNGEQARAEPLLTRLMAQERPGADALNLQLGEVLEKAGKTDEAFERYMQVKQPPALLTSRLRAAQLRIAQGRTDDALALLREAAQQDGGKTTELQLAQATLLVQAKRIPEALKLLDDFMARPPEDAEAIYQVAMLADQVGDRERMEKWLRLLIDKYPDKSAAFNALGYSFADRNIHLDEAEKLIGRALKLEPDNAAIIDSMGWLRFRQGKFKESVALLRRAYAKMEDAEIAAHLGEVLWRAGQKDEARKLLQAARKKHPDSEPLQAVTKRLLK